MRGRLLLTVLFLSGWGPFTCRDGTVDKANGLSRAGKGQDAVEVLKGTDVDQPEVHLSRAVALLVNKQPDESRAELDNAYRSVADALADGRKKPPEAQAHLLDLKRRISFERGQAAVAKEDWKAAYEEFANALRLDPADESARWNLELAWFKLHPPCNLRDDDHEQDDTRADAKPFDPQKADKRTLCPADEDWYALDAPQGSFLYISLEGKVDTSEGEKRDVTLELYDPDAGSDAVRTAPLADGKATVGVSGLPKGGSWKVRVAGPGRAEMTYGLKVELVPPCPADDKLEENDTPETASATKDGEQPGMKACPGDPDWFRVIVPKGEAREIVVRHDPQRGRLGGAVFDATGQTPVAMAQPNAQGVSVTVPKADEEQSVLFQVATTEGQENTYTLVVQKPDDKNDDDKDKNQDQDKDQKKDQDKDQSKQDQPKQDQQQAQNQPKPQPDQAKQIDIDKLIDSLDKQDKNPQLEKALKALPAYPQMEDY